MCLSYGRQFLLRVGSDHTTSQLHLSFWRGYCGCSIVRFRSLDTRESSQEVLYHHSCFKKNFTIHMITGTGEELITALANLIRLILKLQAGSEKRDLPTTQFYVWSVNDQNVLQANLIHAALSSDAIVDDARLCISALAQGAALLQTTYQPILLSGALLGFLSKKKQLKKEYQACLLRMNLPTHGTAEDCRRRVEAAIIKLKGEKIIFSGQPRSGES